MLINNYQNILIKFGLWLATGILIFIVGISDVFALVNNDSITFYDNSGSSATLKSTTFNSNINKSEAIFTTVQNSYGGLAVIQLNQPLVQNHMYTLFVNVGAESNGGFTTLSSKNCIGAGDRASDVITNYINCVISPKYSQRVEVTTDKGRGLYFTFISDRNGAYLAIPYTTQYTCTNCLQYSYGYELTDVGDTSSLNQTQVNNLLQQQTNVINNSINELQDNIVNSNNIISQEIQDTINSNLNTDHPCLNLLNKVNYAMGYIDAQGSFQNSNSNILFTDYIEVQSSNSYVFKSNIQLANATIVEYDSNMNFIQRASKYNTSLFGYIPSVNAKYVRLQINYNNSSISSSIYDSLQLQFEKGTSAGPYCIFGSNETTNKIDDVRDSINDLNSSLTDSSPIDMGSLGNTAGWLPPGPIDSIINLPLNLFNNLLTALNGTCQPINIPLPYVDRDLPIPCISTIFNQINGLPGFWNWVGAITSIVILYRYLLSLYKYYDDLTTLKANFISDFGGEP